MPALLTRPQAAATLRDGLDGRVDVLLLGDIQSHSLHILDGVQCVEVGLLARARIDEISAGGEVFGDLAADPGARAGHHTAFGASLAGASGFGLRAADEGRGGQQHEQPGEEETHEPSTWIL